jgi:hypothetical protein
METRRYGEHRRTPTEKTRPPQRETKEEGGEGMTLYLERQCRMTDDKN